MRIDYEQVAADYGRHRRVHPGVLQTLIERPGLSAGSRVLEVGCGTGNYLTAIHDATNCHGIGIDPAAAMLDQARAKTDRMQWILGSAESLPLEDGSIDLIFSVDVIHHIGDRPAYWREARRVLAQGGLMCTATDSEADLTRRRPLSSHFPETVAYERARYPTISTLSTEMDAAGFLSVATTHTELTYQLTDIQGYRDKAYSSLHLIPADAFARGIAALERDLADGPIPALSLYTLLWGTRG